MTSLNFVPFGSIFDLHIIYLIYFCFSNMWSLRVVFSTFQSLALSLALSFQNSLFLKFNHALQNIAITMST